MECFDLVIVGAGWHGLAMAKTFLEVHNLAKVLVLDYAMSVGGTWASERLYPGLKTNNVVGTYEFSDFPLIPEQYDLKPGQHIPGHVVHRYLCDFCNAFGLTKLIRLRTKVDSAKLLPNGDWELSMSSGQDPKVRGMKPEDDQHKVILASRLVLATGLTSQPFMPPLPGSEAFNGHIFHAKDFKSRAHDLVGVETVVVIGGNKSAWDVCYSASARFGAKAHMVMRRSGGGPSPCWPAKMEGYIKSISAASATRLFTWLDPNPYGSSASAIRVLINRTWLGRKLIGFFWSYLDDKLAKQNGYEDGPATASLRPWCSTFWMGNSLSIHNYETNWFELAQSGQITPHAAQVIKLTEEAVHLSDGSVIKAGAVICCTGWEIQPSIEFFPDGLVERLGFPGTGRENKSMEATVRADILRTTPLLKEPPLREVSRAFGPEKLKPVESNPPGANAADFQTPYRLYRFMLPCDPDIILKRNFCVIGAHITLHTVILAQAQALWITAFFDNKLPELATDSQHSPDMGAIQRSAFHHTEYQKIRRPKETGGMGGRCPDLVFDSIPYVDLLLSDLHLPYHRKTSWYREITQPYRLNDFRGLVAEWRSKNSGTRVV